jgi:DNA-binding IclR family transcriptional regulator
MRLRALAGPSLEGRLLEALLGSPGTIPDLACRTDATRAATRAASHRLRTRGLLEADATTPGALRIPPGILAWLRAPLPRQPIAAARVQ